MALDIGHAVVLEVKGHSWCSLPWYGPMASSCICELSFLPCLSVHCQSLSPRSSLPTAPRTSETCQRLTRTWTTARCSGETLGWEIQQQFSPVYPITSQELCWQGMQAACSSTGRLSPDQGLEQTTACLTCRKYERELRKLRAELQQKSKDLVDKRLVLQVWWGWR